MAQLEESVWMRHLEQQAGPQPDNAWEAPRPGDAVLVLGAAVAEESARAAAEVGREGRVIGVETSDELLARARAQVSSEKSQENLTLVKASLEDLKLDRERVNAWLREHPVQSDSDLAALQATIERFRNDAPLVADDSIDVVIARGVLSRVAPASAQALFSEIFRVLRRGGRVLLSGVASDEDVPDRLHDHPELSSAGISGGVREDEIVRALEKASFYGIHIIDRGEAPRRTVEGIEFREMVVAAYKGKEGPCWECNQAVIYRGPFKSVEDDDGHVLHRGVRIAVCEKTFRILSQQPYRDHVELVQPAVPVPVETAAPFPCADDAIVRDPRVQKGTGAPGPIVFSKPEKVSKTDGSCAPGSSCC